MKINRVIVLSLLIFLFLFLKAAQNTLSRAEFYSKGKKGRSTTSEEEKTIAPLLDFSRFETIKAHNIFLSALESAQKIGLQSSQPPENLAPQPGRNEVQDIKEGSIFKFLGTLSRDKDYLAIFLKSTATAGDENKYFLLQKGEKLSENIIINEVGENWVKLNSGGENIELRVFDLEIKTMPDQNERKKI